MTESAKGLRDFLFRGLSFESEATSFQGAGVQVGADDGQAEERLLSEAIAPFGLARRNQAIEMGRLYVVLNCFENELRELIRETLIEEEGPEWAAGLPKKVKDNAEKRQATALKDSWLEGEKVDILGFVDFGDLASIIIEKWQYFEDLIPSQNWLKQRMEEMEKVRNFIAHHRALLPSEYQRMYMYVQDWNRVIGL